MDDNNVKQELFACCITDGILNDISPEQRIVIILNINEIKEEMLRCAQKKNYFFFFPLDQINLCLI